MWQLPQNKKLLIGLFVSPLINAFLFPLINIMTYIRSLTALCGPRTQFAFDEYLAITHLFYCGQDINVQRFGRDGVSTLIGFGDMALSNIFHIRQWAVRLFHKFGSSSYIVFAWSITCACMALLVYQMSFSLQYFWISLFLIFGSPLAYAVFRLSNYNLMGFAFMPLAIYGIISNQMLVTSLAIAIMIPFSITSPFFSLCLILFAFVLKPSLLFEWWYLIIPITVFAIDLCYCLCIHKKGFKGVFDKLAMTFKIIGGTKRGAKYPRSNKKHFSDVIILVAFLLPGPIIYFSYTNGLSSIPDHWTVSSYALFASSGGFAWFINKWVCRIADNRSIYYIAWMVTSLCAVQSGFPLLLSVYWFVYYRLYSITGEHNGFIFPPMAKPYDISKDLEQMEDSLTDIRKGDLIISLHPNPEGKYENLLKPSCNFMELVYYICVKKGARVFPDWYAIREMNLGKRPECWEDNWKEFDYTGQGQSPTHLLKVHNDLSMELKPFPNEIIKNI